jgi:hypothetical protein
MSIELLPCPFCGGRAELQHTPAEFCEVDGTVEPSAYNVYCFAESCGYRVVLARGHDTAELAAAAWNRRDGAAACEGREGELRRAIVAIVNGAQAVKWICMRDGSDARVVPAALIDAAAAIAMEPNQDQPPARGTTEGKAHE